MPLIPCFNPLTNENIIAHALTLRLYGKFLKQFYNNWIEEYQSGNCINVRLFDNIVSMLNGDTPELCGILGTCAAQCVIEANAGVFLFDFYVLDEYWCRNINTHTVKEILTSATM